MMELTPLLADTSDELEALLLRSAEGDEPETGALERAGAALGLSASALAAATTTGALATHATALGSSAAVGKATLAKELTMLSLAKWLGAGITAGLVTSGAAHLATKPTLYAPPATATATVMVAPVAAPPSEGRPLAPRSPAVQEPEAAPPVTPPATPAAGAASPSSVTAAHVALSPAASGPASASFAPLDDGSKATAALASSLGDETKALDRVREHLAAGRPAQALGEIERYRARWPRGALAAEAALLRVDALLRSGNRSAAEAEANGLITRAPQSRYATRARALLDAGQSPRSSE